MRASFFADEWHEVKWDEKLTGWTVLSGDWKAEDPKTLLLSVPNSYHLPSRMNLNTDLPPPYVVELEITEGTTKNITPNVGVICGSLSRPSGLDPAGACYFINWRGGIIGVDYEGMDPGSFLIIERPEVYRVRIKVGDHGFELTVNDEVIRRGNSTSAFDFRGALGLGTADPQQEYGSVRISNMRIRRLKADEAKFEPVK